MAYGPDVLTGGTPSADSTEGSDVAAQACDNNTATYWASQSTALPHWWKYDLGAAVTKTVRRLRLKPYWDVLGGYVKDFTLQGSNNDADWDVIYTGQHADDNNWETYTFVNATAYRYYKINVTTIWRVASTNVIIYEIEMMERVAVQSGIFLE